MPFVQQSEAPASVGNRSTRQWNPRKWDNSSRLLVFGEALAFLSAALGAVLWLAGVDVPWLFVFAAVVSTFVLTWYAVDLVSQGERPLTLPWVKNVKTIASGVLADSRLDLGIDWENFTVDEDGLLEFPTDLQKTRAMLRRMVAGEYGEKNQREGKRILKLLLDDAEQDTGA